MIFRRGVKDIIIWKSKLILKSVKGYLQIASEILMLIGYWRICKSNGTTYIKGCGEDVIKTVGC